MSPTKIQHNLSLQLSHFRGESECFEAIADQPEPCQVGHWWTGHVFFCFNLEHRRFGCLCLEDLEALGSHFPWITLEPMAHVRWIFESSLPTMSRERWFSWHQVKVLLKFWWAFGLWMLRGLWAWAGMRLASTMNVWKGWSLKFAIIQSISIIISTLYKQGRSWKISENPFQLFGLTLSVQVMPMHPVWTWGSHSWGKRWWRTAGETNSASCRWLPNVHLLIKMTSTWEAIMVVEVALTGLAQIFT